jgi:hypothetical protein
MRSRRLLGRLQLQIHPGVEQILLVTLENLDEKILSGQDSWQIPSPS